MKVAFLYPVTGSLDALPNWVATLRRHCTACEVYQAQNAAACAGADYVFPLTQGEVYPAEWLNRDVAELQAAGKRVGVVHNQDNPGVPAAGDYPSYCWTQAARRKLAAYRPAVMRQPVLPPCVPWESRPLHLGTFGHIEPKKRTLEMAQWARRVGVPFTAFAPDVLANLYGDYIAAVSRAGAGVIVHPWRERIEDLAPLFRHVSHFLFDVRDGKAGSGGSPTSPRYATAFRRPVIVIDDEDTFQEDGCYVYDRLSDVRCLAEDKPPVYDWTPDAYVGALVEMTEDYYRERGLPRGKELPRLRQRT